MTLTLNPDLKKHLPDGNDFFAQIMALRNGEVYRELEGRCTQRIVLGEKAYFLKQHFGVGWKEVFKNIIQGRLPILGAKNEWQALQQLQKLGVHSLQIAAFGSRGLNPASKKSFLLTDELSNVISLEDLCKDWRTNPPSRAKKNALISAVARIARVLHENGINHRDFYICHFLLDLATQDAISPKLYLIDLHRAQIRKAVPTRWLIKDLAGLYFSSKDIGLNARDLFRFIREYRQQPLRHILPRESNFWKKVEQRGDRTYQRHI